MQDLPVELLQYIFMLLSPCSDLPAVIQVCKYWRTVGLEVMKLRQNAIASAYRLEAPLKWKCPKINIPAPTKRFGATVLFHDQYVYVFGGATSMFTTFNDLWRYELSTLTWKRLVVEGDLPTPRAHAKGGFIGDTLYLFGGCHSYHLPGMYHTGRMEWLSDLSSFNTHSQCWSKHPLRHVEGLMMEPPIPVTAGQTGCFLPAGDIAHPSVLVLFGGISQSMTDCVNDVCLINPVEGEWMSLSAPSWDANDPVPWPTGRCGHSVCALDSTRMLVLFGNLQSPVAQPASAESPPPRRQRLPNDAERGVDEALEEDPSYHGQPAGDIWILTRSKAEPNSCDWSSVHWYWTKVCCPRSPFGCPPLDFYHACTICLPWTSATSVGPDEPQFIVSDAENCSTVDLKLQTQTSSNTEPRRTFTVVCISQPTRALLDEATKQRRFWWHRARSGPESRLKSVLRSASLSIPITELDPGHSADASGGCRGSCDSVPMSNPLTPPPCSSVLSLAVPSEEQVSRTPGHRTTVSLPPSPQTPSSSIQGSRRSAERRARQLEALAVQERRLFGSRGSPSQTNSVSPSDSTSPTSQYLAGLNQPDPLCNLLQSGTLRPLATYTLCIHIPTQDNDSLSSTESNRSTTNDQPVVGQWLTPKKSHFIDLVFGPPECLGFSCTFGHGCLFLFGGLCDSDEASRERRHLIPPAPPPAADAPLPDERIQPLEPARQSDSVASRGGDLGSPRSNAIRTSQFYVLQPRSLVGTLL